VRIGILALASHLALPLGCGQRDAEGSPLSSASASSTSPTIPAGVAPPLPTAASAVVAPAASARPAPPRSRTGASCAPCLSHARPFDARSEAALARCLPLKTGQAKASTRCGEDGRALEDPGRLIDAVPPLDDATIERVRRVAATGKALGRNPRAFGVVGDSISVAYEFLTPLSSSRDRPLALDPWAAEQLALPAGGTVIDWFRGQPVEIAQRSGKDARDSFAAYRAALVGARASWPQSEGFAPLRELETRVSPAVAVVTFGANDAAFREAPPEALADEYEKATLGLVEALEARGIVVVLSNEMRHGDQPGRKACPGEGAGSSDWQVAVAQNATTARAAELACREHLPFIDLRHALDGSTNFGLGPDAVHLSSHRQGAALFTKEGLDCGYNVRNFVTLLALARVVPHLAAVYDSSSQ
jgi:hypothetical protein